ncbi:hypothetical protein IH979_00940 [Patescibacteria group bacterium]|nr:hypothetical protein [Patescibacteria group bacterium]
MTALTLVLKYFFIDLIGGIIRWPVWWYTKGLVLVLQWAVNSVQGYARMLAISVWIKNIFVPMFGQRDWQSRLISFFMRVFQIIARGFVLIVWTLIIALLTVLYIALPIVAALMAIYHLTGGFIVYA